MTVLFSNIANDATEGAGTSRRVSAYQFTCSTTGAAKTLKFYANTAGIQIKWAIYDRPSVTPNDLLQAESNLITTVVGVNTVVFPTAISLTAGTIYFASFVASTGTNVIDANAAITINRYHSSTLALITDAMPDPWTVVGNTGSRKLPYLIIESAEPSIVSIDQCVAGQPIQLNFNEAFAPTSATITGDTIGKTFALSVVDADSVSGTIPQWVDGETCVPLGNVIITATDGDEITDDFNDVLSMRYNHPDDSDYVPFTEVTLTSVSAESFSTKFSLSPAWQVGTQVVFDSARFSFGVDGVGTSDYTGSSYLWYRNHDDKIALLVTINTIDGGIAPEDSGGLTSVGLTSIGPTSIGLTSVGL